MFLYIFMVQGTPGPDNIFDAIVPGSSVPEWFIHQSMGSSVTVELPPHCYNTKLMGLAVCAVFDADPTIDGAYLQFFCHRGGRCYLDEKVFMLPPKKADHVSFGYRSLSRLECCGMRSMWFWE
ncbi:hypothetical protein PVL29_024713 [Vitis rotundifolia]|uniref:C-JID domain-containing protein n=1 Tax=Vitis rotundifolia TaxID=103349 RepID=A0AA39D9E9_VITRO|nr:hypothetical protein PVL29_024713 [Vitis rotundifolia]